MIITKPEKTDDLYPLFKQILIENHKPDLTAGWGAVTFTGRGFYLKLTGEYRSDGKRLTIDIEHPDEYFLEKFHMSDQYWSSVYLDRFIIMNFCKDYKGRKSEWMTYIYQHQKE